MKTKQQRILIGLATLAWLSTLNLQLSTLFAQSTAFTNQARLSERGAAIPLAELGAKAGAQYQGEGLCVLSAREGPRLRCVFQKLEGQATAEGLWLVSTVDETRGDRFRVVATSLGREEQSSPVAAEVTRLTSAFDFEFQFSDFESEAPHVGSYSAGSKVLLASTGTVAVVDKLARFVRPGLVEEYSVSVDGVRQDFLVLERPGGEGKLRVELDVSGAKAEALLNAARLVLDGSGHKIAYSRLRVVDAHGCELAARMEVTSASRLAVVVDDATAAYPVRIDPTFSDADWVSMGSGLNGDVYALAVSAADLYVGGIFTAAGGLAATNIAKWNGSAWSALGTGLDGVVYALAVSSTNLYVGGFFTTADNSGATSIAKWNGSSWSALGSGLDADGRVLALAVSGSDLYVGGTFTNAGDLAVNRIAKWNGSTWSAFGSGVEGSFSPSVEAFAVSGTDLYVGGRFTMAGGVAATNIAKWNGSMWSAVGKGLYHYLSSGTSVRALAVSGTNLYAGGNFIQSGFMRTDGVAKWNGTAWLPLGSALPRIGGPVLALAASGTNLYVGGFFTTAGGLPATNIAKWNGSAWSALGSGVNREVNALAVSGSDLYVGGYFTEAGGKVSIGLARAVIGPPSLRIARINTNTVMVSWESPSADFTLQQNTNLNTTNWVAPAESVSDDGTNKSILVDPPSGNRFYRLFKP